MIYKQLFSCFLQMCLIFCNFVAQKSSYIFKTGVEIFSAHLLFYMGKKNGIQLKELITLRKHFHKHPELSHKEHQTSEKLLEEIQKTNPDDLIHSLGGHGILAVYSGKEKGPVVLFRTDIDALPIEEENDFDYKSKKPGVSHKCGHDGHMTMMLGLARKIAEDRPKKGKVLLLFQPAEEVGEGADLVIKDKKFTFSPDYAFALHNLPGFKKGEIILKEGGFASASTGMIIRFKGKTSHAGEPENGRSPVIAMSRMMEYLTNLPSLYQGFKDFVLVTVIHARLGERAFGTTPGYGEVMATLRATKDEDIDLLKGLAEGYAEEQGDEFGLKIDFEYVEVFPATNNHKEAVEMIKKSASKNQLEVHTIDKAFRWSEDFGHFTRMSKGAMFGLGSGEDHPQLHNPDYDFPDEILETGIETFYQIYKQF